MNYPADYHMHTRLCKHANGDPIDYARRAVELGMTEIGFSEHAPMIRDDYDNWHMDLKDIEPYLENVERARQAFPSLTIRVGLEMDYLPGHEEWIKTISAKYPWDYLIGSVHYIGEEWDFDNPEKLEPWRTGNVDEIWRDYFELLAQSVTSDLFDIVGHADLCKKFAFYPAQPAVGFAIEFLDTVQRCGKAIEINTAGLRKDCKEMYPSPAILQEARKRDIPLTFGADAHDPSEVGMNFLEGMALAKDCGYTETLVFESRKARVVPIP